LIRAGLLERTGDFAVACFFLPVKLAIASILIHFFADGLSGHGVFESGDGFIPFFMAAGPATHCAPSWRVSCKSPSNRHKTSARGHRSGVASGKRFSQKARIAQESHAQPGEEQEGRR
jgi:hypothetical protein